MRRLLTVIVPSLIVVLFVSGRSIFTDAFSCKDEEERFNKADAEYDRNWPLYLNDQLTAAQWSDITQEYGEASNAYRSCKDN